MGLAKLLRANAHHGAIPKFKRNLLLREFIPSEGCSAQTMSCAALDYMVFGEAYFLA
ncbi:phage portal protein, partial [Pseudomonas sp. MH2]|nr:phage portal protein [Pseudomonas sp. MH2]